MPIPDEDDAARFRVRPVVRPPVTSESEDSSPRQESRDETDEGWGETSARRDAAWYERQRPPHHE